MARSSRSPDHLRLPLLAGWLFADLFIVLFIISLASGVITPSGQGPTKLRPTVTPAASPGPTRSPIPRPAPSQHGVLQEVPVDIYVPVPSPELQGLYADPGSDKSLLQSLLSQLTSREKTERAGFVQLFLPGTDSQLATNIATDIANELPQQDPALFAGAVTQGFWHGDTSNAEFQIFFVALSAPPTTCRRQSLTEGERGERE